MSTKPRQSSHSALIDALLEELRENRKETRAGLEAVAAEVRDMKAAMPNMRAIYVMGAAFLVTALFSLALVAEGRGIDTRAAAEAAHLLTPTVP
jgi:hypothetical protein